jgi:DNA polymerase III delta prime subunit
MPPAAARRGARRGTPKRSTAKSAREAPESIEEEEVVIEIEELSDYNESKNILLHGPSGHGKTVLAGGAARDFRCLFLSTEKGVVSAKRAGSKAQVMRAPDWQHVVAGLNRADQELAPEDWLIVDSGTKMQVLYIRWILQQIHDQNAMRDLDIPAIQDHQKWQNGFKRFCDRIIDSHYNTIFITTSMQTENEDGDDMVIPDLTGKQNQISNYISAQFDVAMYYAVAPQKSRTEPMVRRALTQPYPPYFAKDRYNVFGRWQDVPEGDYTAMSDFIGMILDADAATDAS